MRILERRFVGLLVVLLVGIALVTACGGRARTGGGAAPQANTQLADKGKQLFTQFQCVTCHSTTGQKLVGPPLNGLYGSQVKLDNGQTVAADDQYIRESIEQPDAKIVAGYQKGIMAGVVGAEEAQIKQGDNLAALVEYIKSLK